MTSSGNPIELDLSNKYVVKGIKKEQVMDSKVKIWIGSDGKIEKLEDRWNDKLPEGGISEVSWTPSSILMSLVHSARDSLFMSRGPRCRI